MKTLVIGRDPFADVVVADSSLAAHHAELTVLGGGRYFLTDCGTEAGTWRRAGEGGEAAWEPVRQAFVRAEMTIRLGDYACTIEDLVQAARGRYVSTQDEPGLSGGGGAAAGGQAMRRRGRVERDPKTGEIVRRRR